MRLTAGAPRSAHSEALNLSTLLREETRDAHRAVEVAFDLDARLADHRAYGALLTTLDGFYRPVEDALGELKGWDGLTPAVDVRRRQRATLLDTDLQQLGLPLPPAERAVPAVLPTLESLAQGLGCLYVLEGSALGGQIVAHRARAALGPRVPLAFFSSVNRRNLRADWRSLQAALDAFGIQQGDAVRASVVEAAIETFGALVTWLDLEVQRG